MLKFFYGVIVVFIFILFCNPTHANNWVVTNLNDSGPGSLRSMSLVAGANDTISFDSALLSSQNDTIYLNSVIGFTEPIVIKGLVVGTDSLFISGQNTCQIFNINLDASMAPVRYAVLENMFFVDGHSTTGGGAVFFEGDSIYVYNCFFTNNYSDSHSGGLGAHRNNVPGWGLIHLENSIFIGNTGDTGGGAGMYSFGSIKAEVLNCKFINNETTYAAQSMSGGGGLRIYGDNAVIITIDQCDFIDNTSVYHGGAVHVYSDHNISADVTNSLFENNFTAYRGGGLSIYNNGGGDAILLLSHCIFNSNEGYDGGAIYCLSRDGGHCNVLMEFTTLSYNIAAGSGGGLWAEATWAVGSSDNFADVDINYSTIHHNSSQALGGGIAVVVNPQTGAGDEGESYLTIYKSTIAHNTALSSGGGVYNYVGYQSAPVGFPKKCHTTVEKSTIVYNEAPVGAGIYNRLWSATASYTKLFTESSIIAFNGDTSIFSFNATSLITSSGYSVFSDSLINGIGITDTNDVDSLQLLLGPLVDNGGLTLTMVPEASSIAINNGTPGNVSMAQNWPISDGQRDVGAAENVCVEYITDTIYGCDSLVSPSGLYIWYESGNYVDTLFSILGCDTLFGITFFNNTSAQDEFASVCFNTSYIFPDAFVMNNIQSDTFHVSNLSSILGCDSVITTYVSIDTINTTENFTICSGSDYFFPDGYLMLDINADTVYTSYLLTIGGCDSAITTSLQVIQLDTNITQTNTSLLALETSANFQWLDCNSGLSEILGETAAGFQATAISNVALRYEKSGCVDTTACISISAQDFYDELWYQSMQLEVFAYPVTHLDSCDALANAFVFGGIPPFSYDWFTQANNNNTDQIDSLCEGVHTLKVFDNIGDSVMVDYYITDSLNFTEWYLSGVTYVDTLYIVAENCIIDLNLPIDSAWVSNTIYLYPGIPSGEYYLIELSYAQAGNVYSHLDTVLLTNYGWYLIDFSVVCSIKSAGMIKVILFSYNHFEGVSIGQIFNNQGITIYPNPSDGNVRIFVPHAGNAVVFDNSGKLVESYHLNEGTNQSQMKVSSGVYLIRISLEKGVTFYQKLIVQ